MTKATALKIVNTNAKAGAKAGAKATGKATGKDTAKTPLQYDPAIIGRIAESLKAITETESLRERLLDDIAIMRSYNVKLGKSRRTCGQCAELFTAMVTAGIKETTASDYLSALRVAINDGGPLILNNARRKAYLERKNGTGGASGKGGKGGASGKGGKGGKGGNAPKAWSTSGEVLDALAKAITAIRDKAPSNLWVDALNMAPIGFKECITDFLDAQGGEE